MAAPLGDISASADEIAVVDEFADSEPAVDLGWHYRQIYRYVRRRSRSDADAQDITQEVFEAAAYALERSKPGGPPILAWLYTVAQRRLVDAARRAARRREAGDETLLELVAAPPLEYGGELAGALEQGLRTLPLLQRQVVVMKLLHGLSFAEIATATRSSEGACRMRFLRGLEQLRDFLEEEGIVP
jgi:RNA polymerase sigma-70 factor (ECF subfamily)